VMNAACLLVGVLLLFRSYFRSQNLRTAIGQDGAQR